MEEQEMMGIIMSTPLMEVCMGIVEIMAEKNLKTKETVLEFDDVKFTIKGEIKEEETTEMEEKQ